MSGSHSLNPVPHMLSGLSELFYRSVLLLDEGSFSVGGDGLLESLDFLVFSLISELEMINSDCISSSIMYCYNNSCFMCV